MTSFTAVLFDWGKPEIFRQKVIFSSAPLPKSTRCSGLGGQKGELPYEIYHFFLIQN